jgi:exodeoxyribonuclease III
MVFGNFFITRSSIMLLISWNVAGLSTTTNRIHESYNVAAANGKKKQPASSALAEYMGRHGADIFCLQEHKIPLSQLSARSEPRGSSTVEGYESFWSCCSDTSKRGFNGVVTYVKQGMVVSANSKPLGSPDLDEQGRCIMTDHGSFVVFNVYAPANGGNPLTYKMKFLNALRRAMKEQRDKQKAVMLVGDLNIRHTHLDTFWSDRVVFVRDIMIETANELVQDKLPKWKLELAEAWPKIDEALQNKEIVSTQTTNSLTNQKFNKFRLAVTVNNSRVYLGNHESSADSCHYYYDYRSRTYNCPDTGDELLAEEENMVSIKRLAELMSKIAGIDWDEKTKRSIAEEEGSTSRVSPPRKWLNAMLEEDAMVDTFRHFYPKAEGRFTCWDQFKNRRYINEGVRLDYTLVDRSMLPHVQKGDVESLRCCGSQEDPMSEAAALCAVTSDGGFQPVSFEGGGIMESSQDTLDTQFGTAHTGIIYTPPSFSDHIAVSLLMDDTCCSRDLILDEKDSTTKKSQPHKSQKSIGAFFGISNGCKPASKPLTTTTKPTNVASKRKGIQNFFAVQSADAITDKRPKNETAKKLIATPSTKPVAPKRLRVSVRNHFQKK